MSFKASVDGPRPMITIAHLEVMAQFTALFAEVENEAKKQLYSILTDASCC